jgi:hypothetical protein
LTIALVNEFAGAGVNTAPFDRRPPSVITGLTATGNGGVVEHAS